MPLLFQEFLPIFKHTPQSLCNGWSTQRVSDTVHASQHVHNIKHKNGLSQVMGDMVPELFSLRQLTKKVLGNKGTPVLIEKPLLKHAFHVIAYDDT